MNEKIGFIGLGKMGRPMAKNLMKAGYDLAVYNRSRAAVDELAGLGARPCSSPRQAAEESDVVITMLPDSPDVEQVVLGKDGVADGIRTGSVFIDMSSINPAVSRRLAARLSEKGVHVLDAPVSGGEPGAMAGTLAIMVGGDPEIFERCRPVLAAMGKTVTRVGDAGAGQVAKLVNQIIVASNIAAIGEAFCLGVRAGVDPRTIFEAIKDGLAGSAVMNAKMPKLLERNFSPGFRVRLHHKDLNNALELGKELSIPLPMTSLLQQFVRGLIDSGRGDEDHAAIAGFFETLTGVRIQKV